MTLVVTKTQLMESVISGRQRECFQHSEAGIFDITALRGGLATGAIPAELVNVALGNFVPFIKENRVTEQERIDNLAEASWEHDPAIFLVILEDDGSISHLMVDGHHRALRREKEGRKDMLCWMVEVKDAPRPAPGWVQNPFVDWGDALVDGKIVRRQL